MNNIQILDHKDRQVIQTYFKLRYNHNDFTFIDYVYKDSKEPVDCGELASIFDSTGHLVEDEEIKDTFGVFVDMWRSGNP